MKLMKRNFGSSMNAITGMKNAPAPHPKKSPLSPEKKQLRSAEPAGYKAWRLRYGNQDGRNQKGLAYRK